MRNMAIFRTSSIWPAENLKRFQDLWRVRLEECLILHTMLAQPTERNVTGEQADGRLLLRKAGDAATPTGRLASEMDEGGNFGATLI